MAFKIYGCRRRQLAFSSACDCCYGDRCVTMATQRGNIEEAHKGSEAHMKQWSVGSVCPCWFSISWLVCAAHCPAKISWYSLLKKKKKKRVMFLLFVVWLQQHKACVFWQSRTIYCHHYVVFHKTGENKRESPSAPAEWEKKLKPLFGIHTTSFITCLKAIITQTGHCAVSPLGHRAEWNMLGGCPREIQEPVLNWLWVWVISESYSLLGTLRAWLK